MSKTTRKARTWEPKCRAATHADRRTRRKRTRVDVEQTEIDASLASDTCRNELERIAELEEGRLMDALDEMADRKLKMLELDTEIEDFLTSDDNLTKY